MQRGAIVVFLILATVLAAQPLSADEVRSANIDVVVLLDKSLSMAQAEASARQFVAGEVIGPILLPGDRIIVETFYGQVDRLFAGTIRSEEDKAGLVRSLNRVTADGKYTDIGLALDRAAQDLEELGSPEREKYVLLVTDERQEAPGGSKYVSTDYSLKHPALDYVKRVDHGSFRVITVGFGIAQRVDEAAVKVMSLLSEPPERRAEYFKDMPAGTSPGLDGAEGSGAGDGAAAGGSANGKGGKATGKAGGNADDSASGGGPSILVLALAGGGLLVALVLAVIAFLAVKSRRDRSKDSRLE